MKLSFNINFNTKFGEKLQLVILEHSSEIYQEMSYIDNGDWQVEVEVASKTINYKYQLINDFGHILDTEYTIHHLNLFHNYENFRVYDTWNLKNFPENYLNNKVLKNKLRAFKPQRISVLKKDTHLFRIEAPLYHHQWAIVVSGNTYALGNWDLDKAVEMKQTDYGVWEIAVDHSNNDRIIEYKYAIKDLANGQVQALEYGENRRAKPNVEKNTLQIQADHYFKYRASELYHAAGVAVPVFSLRSKNGFGVGEFSDIKLLADWAKETNLGMIQTLPINDTTANYSWTDSYPYAPISLYALHPQYISLECLDFPLNKKILKEYTEKKAELNALNLIDYEQVMTYKWKFLRVVFTENKDEILKDVEFKKFLKDNENWLLPYSAFCILRDRYKTPNFTEWNTHKAYIAGKVSSFFSPKSKDYQEAMLHSWVQYQLHKQLKEAIDYTHSLGISVKGDLPIGIYRYSVEAWTEPELYGMDFQAGAPPDMFSDLGQNWGFPTYNWERMKEDGYRWWKSRFRALEQYFDAMRIDHILGFFRIWRTPIASTQALLGYFYPAIGVSMAEFEARHIPFNYDRYCKPFINEEILWKFFGEERYNIAEVFMNNHFNGTYSLKEEFDTQRKLTNYFKNNPHWAEDTLINLCANVLFIQEDKGNGAYVYHPRFNIHKTDSYHYLSDWEKQALYELYADYFFKRQDGLWYQSAMEKLPAILNTTDMLICGEDLGMVPDCVPVVMDKLAITALKVQRMPPGDAQIYDPRDASYMNVVTASSHDSSTLRQWWQEDRDLTQFYFNHQLNQYGTAPSHLEPYLAEIIMLQHLYNDAMLAIFPIQEFFATDPELANPNMNEERINDPAVFPHYWRYRMHLDLETLKKKNAFNAKIAHWVEDSGRK